jgi:murein DD-endopeptidase MepM/ murein hydrolase activator NlpD
MMKIRFILYGLVVLLATLVLGVGSYGLAEAEDIDELREKLESRRETLRGAESDIKKFKEEIQLKKKEARSLEEQIDIIEDNIYHIELSIKETVAEIEATNAEIDVVELEIEQKTGEIKHQKELLAEYIRLIYNLSQQSGVAVFLKYTTFSEAVSEATTLQDLQERSHETLLKIKELKEQLEEKRNDLQEFKEALERLQERQEGQQATLLANRESKEHVLSLTKEQEQKYQELLQESKTAHQQAEAEIKKLDSLIREELRRQGISKLPSVGVFDWPVDPIFGVSCEFRCADYPYAYLIGPHSGMDMPTYVGTPVIAPADGYVARVHNANGPGYNYLLLLHGGEVSTVYGHLSGFTVSEGEMVSRGTIIGYTGGAPGTNGAGLSTGPHLHFEVRVNNSPVNPREYL